MSSFQDEKKRDKKLMQTVNTIITIILGTGIIAIWLDSRQDISNKIGVGLLYLFILIIYILTP